MLLYITNKSTTKSREREKKREREKVKVVSKLDYKHLGHNKVQQSTKKSTQKQTKDYLRHSKDLGEEKSDGNGYLGGHTDSPTELNGSYLCDIYRSNNSGCTCKSRSGRIKLLL